MILPGVCTDKDAQRKSLEWIREQSMSDDCIESLANHDADDIVNITLHFFLKDVRSMLPPAVNHSIAVS